MRLLCGESLLKDPRYSRAAMLNLQCSPCTSTAVSLILSSSFITRSPLFFPLPFSSRSLLSLTHSHHLSVVAIHFVHLLSLCVRVVSLSHCCLSHQCCCSQKRWGGSPLFRLPPAISLLLDSNQERKHWCESLHQANLCALDHMGSPCLCSRVDFVSRAWK